MNNNDFIENNADFLLHIGNAIDNVYNNTAEGDARRTSATFRGSHLVIEYRTILRAAKDQELEHQLSLLKSESAQMVASRLKTIKASYKEHAGKNLKAKKVDEKESIETLTVSPFNPIRTLKFTCACYFEVA